MLFIVEIVKDRYITMIHFLERNWSKLIKNKNETHLTHASYENIAKTSRKEQISGYHAHSFFLDYCIHMWDHKGYIVPSTCCDKSALRYGNFFCNSIDSYADILYTEDNISHPFLRSRVCVKRTFLLQDSKSLWIYKERHVTKGRLEVTCS